MYLAKAMGGGVWSTIAGLVSEAACTFGSSVGYNWANNRDLFESFVIGAGPVMVPFRKGGLSTDWQDWVWGNIGTSATNAVGLTNLLFGGKVDFNLANLTPVYSGGFLDPIYNAFGTAATGLNVVAGNNTYTTQASYLNHEFNHIWQSRMLGNFYFMGYGWQGLFLINYSWQGILGMIMGGSFSKEGNCFEAQAYGGHWY
jgi:hypothetical protein